MRRFQGAQLRTPRGRQLAAAEMRRAAMAAELVALLRLRAERAAKAAAAKKVELVRAAGFREGQPRLAAQRPLQFGKRRNSHAVLP